MTSVFKYHFAVILFVSLSVRKWLFKSPEEARKEYESDPVIGMHYNAEQDVTMFDTRTMNFDARDCDGKRCLLNCTLPSHVKAVRPIRGIPVRGSYLRSLSPEPRFLDDRKLSLTIDGHVYDLGVCEHNGAKNTDGGVLEDLSVAIQNESIFALVRAIR